MSKPISSDQLFNAALRLVVELGYTPEMAISTAIELKERADTASAPAQTSEASDAVRS